ncbi:MAG: hydroxymethylglutaryl-CoA synthase [Thermoflexales bacterium]|nr:hydroxymethylglutaryl-CoA synthase [Thermoflexales bacterium]
MKPSRPVGITGYGAYVPRYRLAGQAVSELWTDGNAQPPVREKAVPGLDEDVATMSIEAARNAIARASYADPAFSPAELGAVWVGSESHPYAVKPTSTIVAEAIGATPYTQAADWQFACKAGTEAIQAAIGFVGSGMAAYALAIGMDAAQGRPGDALEYTAGAGGAAFVIGPAERALVEIEGSVSYVTDTPDFWRRQYEKYPEHAGRFTGEPAYFHHIIASVTALLRQMNLSARDFAYAVFHQPNVKFPLKVGEELGFTREQLRPGLLVNDIGNTYAGSSVIGLTAILDIAQPGDRILLASFGSGAGSDAFCLRVRKTVAAKDVWTTQEYVQRRTPIDYAQYSRMKGNYKLN